MPTRTSLDNLTTVLGQIISQATGRLWWDKRKIQATPAGPYALVYLTGDEGYAGQDVVEWVERDTPGPHAESLQQVAWGTSLVRCTIEFYRDGVYPDTARNAANRFKNALQLQQRWEDLWLISGMAGPVAMIDLTTIFRADVEGRARVDFSLHANLADPLPLEIDLHEIDSLGIGITVQPQDDLIEVDITRGTPPVPY